MNIERIVCAVFAVACIALGVWVSIVTGSVTSPDRTPRHGKPARRRTVRRLKT